MRGAKSWLLLSPLVLVMLFGAASCDSTGGSGGSGSGCGEPEECGSGTYWNGSQCAPKSNLCGSGASYDESTDKCTAD